VRGAEVCDRAGSLQQRGGFLEGGDGLAQKFDNKCKRHTITAGHAMISAGNTPFKTENSGTTPSRSTSPS
jgi:hypothetical protein